MNQEHFLTELKIQLKPLSPQQVAYILQTYEEKFAERIAAGETEVMISKDLGSPQIIAAEILKEFKIENPQVTRKTDEWQEFTAPQSDSQSQYHPYYQTNYPTKSSSPSFFIRFCQIIGILALNFFFMLWIILGGLMLVFAFWLVVAVLLGAPILGVIVFATGTGAYALFQLFISILLAGCGLIGLAIMLPITRYTFRFLKYYTRWTLNTLRGRTA